MVVPVSSKRFPVHLLFWPFPVVSSLLPCLIPHCFFLDEDFKASLQLANMPLETQVEPPAKARQHILNKNRKELLRYAQI